MKLDHKRTVLVGLALLSICAFWQMYDNIIPLILTHTFQLDETVCGAIMAADNVLALVLLPFFGALSDRTSTRIGRRMPFILGGTADMRIVGVPPCSDVFGQGDMEKRQRRQRLPAVGRGIGGAAGAVPAHLLLREPAVAVDRRDC